VAGTSDQETSGGGRATGCADCGAAMGDDQRYCVACGARRGPLPSAVAAAVGAVIAAARAGREPSTSAAAETGATAFSWLPSPRAAAVAVMAMLALGVILGSVTERVAQSAPASSIVVEVPVEEEPAPPAEEEIEEAPVEEAAPEEALPEEAFPEPAPEASPPAEPEEEEPLVPFDPEADESELPDVNHVFVIVLGENGFEETFGTDSTAPYLAKELPAKGALLSNYYAVAPGELANGIALISGQGPTPETVANCPNYADVVPGTESEAGQVEGNGCVYPATTKTLPGQLAEGGLTWKAYVEDVGNAPGQPTSCRRPELGTPDAKRTAVPGDAYLTWRNPFVYFHSLVDGSECAERDVGLDQLALDLKAKKKTPTFSYIVPSACHDGGAVPCEPGLVAGPAETEAFLRQVVPQILESPAFEEDGLIAITSTQAQQTGPTADSSACCVYPEYPNLPPPASAEEVSGSTKPSGGGGRVGMLLLSPFIKAGTVDEGYYNHYSLLLTIEELLELEKLGYANEISLSAFGSSIFNVKTEEKPKKKSSGGNFFGRLGLPDW